MKTSGKVTAALFVLLCGASLLTGCENQRDRDKDMNDRGDSVGRVDDRGRTERNNAMQHAMASIEATQPDIQLSGSAQFETLKNGKVRMMLKLNIPSKANQSVAVHLHEFGMCDNAGEAAGAHWNPTGEQHGKWGTNGFHAGDIGNVELDRDGNGQTELETDHWTIGGNASSNILDKSVIVHAGTDDYTSQPSGNSGARIGCGVIRSSANR